MSRALVIGAGVGGICVALALQERGAATTLVERSAKLGRRTLKRIQEWERFDGVADTRGLGLCLAVELGRPGHLRTPDPATTRRVFFDCVRHGAVPHRAERSAKLMRKLARDHDFVRSSARILQAEEARP